MNRIMKFQVIFFMLICVFSINLFATENSETGSVERFALYVSANNGGKERDVLRYATSDAEKLKTAMQEIGGVESENSILLKEPKQVEVEKALQDFAEKVNSAIQHTDNLINYYRKNLMNPGNENNNN